jgi:GxxExxY protein
LDAKAQRRRDENELSYAVIGAAIDVHRELGPGLLESIYEECLCIELRNRGIGYERQRAVPVVYKGVDVGIGYRLDLLVERVLVVELKVSETCAAIHASQVLTYLRLTGCRLGLLINFGMPTVRDGVERIVNDLPE